MRFKALWVGCGMFAAAVLPAFAQVCQQNDLSAYFVPNYAGWDTAKRTWIGSDGSSSNERWYSYATNKYAHIKFSDPHSVETFQVASLYIYITAENGENGGNASRTWPGGLTWLPRYGFTCTGCTAQENQLCIAQNQYAFCYSAQNNYGGSCQLLSSDPQHCDINPSNLNFVSYNYGYSIGTLPTLIKNDRADAGGTERYFYGLGRGLLRYEAYNSSGVLTQWAQQTGEVANQPLADQACFHP